MNSGAPARIINAQVIHLGFDDPGRGVGVLESDHVLIIPRPGFFGARRMAKADRPRRSPAPARLPDRGRPAPPVVRTARPDRKRPPIRPMAARAHPALRDALPPFPGQRPRAGARRFLGMAHLRQQVPSLLQPLYGHGRPSSVPSRAGEASRSKAEGPPDLVLRLFPAILRPLLAILLRLPVRAAPVLDKISRQVLPGVRLLPFHPGRDGHRRRLARREAGETGPSGRSS